jgi:hypothetical protein
MVLTYSEIPLVSLYLPEVLCWRQFSSIANINSLVIVILVVIIVAIIIHVLMNFHYFSFCYYLIAILAFAVESAEGVFLGHVLQRHLCTILKVWDVRYVRFSFVVFPLILILYIFQENAFISAKRAPTKPLPRQQVRYFPVTLISF